MCKSVLISIRPKWCEKIISGEKTIEVRKNRPKLETPFKAYIYCTTGRPDLNIPISRERLMQDYLNTGSMKSLNCPHGNGKVIGEFTCDRIYKISKRGIPKNFDYCYLSLNGWGNDDIEAEIKAISASCVSKEELNTYGTKAPFLYGWHISDLAIYDEPKELDEFWVYNEALHKRYDTGTDFCCYDAADEYGEALTDCGDAYNEILNCYRCWSEWSGWCHRVNRPPQSWCYVEGEDVKENVCGEG